jgi:hypothetical protein
MWWASERTAHEAKDAKHIKDEKVRKVAVQHVALVETERGLFSLIWFDLV